MRLLLRLGAVPLAMAVLAACNGDEDGERALEQALRRMVLQPEQLPEGLLRGEESFLTNDALASSSADPAARKALLERWGRLLGFETTYKPSGTAEEFPAQGIDVSAALFRTEAGARESFADAVRTAEETDWAANYSGLRGFQQAEVDASGLADEIMWLRLSGFQPATRGPDALVTDDLIFFRVGRERGFLRVLANSIGTEERRHYQATVKGWLQALLQNVKDALAEGGFAMEDAE